MAVDIPPDEISVRFSRSSGPGGQNVNKRDTRVELTWNVEATRALSASQKARVRARLARRLDDEGRIRVTASAERTQSANRAAALARLRTIVEGALRPPPPPRKPTKPTRSATERRLREKKLRGELKRSRSYSDD
ncbi:MAG: alternative ribosome rescue aminoacyl-tRNA hydrolase ArfB [Actinomycetota bacterium]